VPRQSGDLILLTKTPTDTVAAAAPQPIIGGPPELETGGVLTVDLAAVAMNWRALMQRSVPADCAAVIKADAYGCGLEPVAVELARAGCRTFFVASLAEARRLRAVGPEAVIYVLNGIAPGSAELFATIDARPVIGNIAEFVEWDAFRRASGWQGGAALHFDTGMNRLGLSVEEAPALSARVKAPDHGISLVMSHLACADTKAHPLNNSQIEAFRQLRYMFRGVTASLANSSGIFLGPAAQCDMVRPGAALFGINPTPGAQNLMEPTVTLKGRIVQIRSVERGGTVGYGATWTAARPSRVAIVSVGYGDGYFRITGNVPAGKKGTPIPAQAVVANRRCPLIGRISMDLIALDITAVTEGAVRRGDFATLIGDGVSVDEFATWCGTIGYEVLTNLGHRYHRVWLR
jgi:alanine racemase